MNNDFINIEKLISVFSTDFEKTLISFLPKTLFFSDKLDKAMYYVVKVGGKRLRPLILKRNFFDSRYQERKFRQSCCRY